MKKLIGWMGALALVVVLAGCQPKELKSSTIFSDDKQIAKTEDVFHYTDKGDETFTKDSLMVKTKFDGLQTFWTIDAKAADNLEIDYQADVKAGKLKFVLVDPDGKVTTIFDGSKSDTFTTELAKGESMLKLVGVDAEAELSITLKPGSQSIVKKFDSLDKMDKEIDKEIDSDAK